MGGTVFDHWRSWWCNLMHERIFEYNIAAERIFEYNLPHEKNRCPTSSEQQNGWTVVNLSKSRTGEPIWKVQPSSWWNMVKCFVSNSAASSIWIEDVTYWCSKPLWTAAPASASGFGLSGMNPITSATRMGTSPIFRTPRTSRIGHCPGRDIGWIPRLTMTTATPRLWLHRATRNEPLQKLKAELSVGRITPYCLSAKYSVSLVSPWSRNSFLLLGDVVSENPSPQPWRHSWSVPTLVLLQPNP